MERLLGTSLAGWVWTLVFWAVVFLAACLTLHAVRGRFRRWEAVRYAARYRYFHLLWPIYAIMRVIDAGASIWDWVRDSSIELFEWVWSFRTVRALTAFAVWWVLQPWEVNFWPSALKFGSFTPYLIPLFFIGIYWPMASLLAPLTRRYSWFTVIEMLGAIYLVSMIGLVAWVLITNGGLHIERPPAWQKWPDAPWVDLLAGFFTLVGIASGASIMVTTYLLPLSIFWPRYIPPEGPKYGDAQFANPTALKSQGVVDER